MLVESPRIPHQVCSEALRSLDIYRSRARSARMAVCRNRATIRASIVKRPAS